MEKAANERHAARLLYEIRDTSLMAIATCLPAEGLICWISTAD